MTTQYLTLLQQILDEGYDKGDRTVPYRQATILLEKLQQAKVPAKLITLDSGSHAFWNGSGPLAKKTLADAIAFFEKTLRAKTAEK